MGNFGDGTISAFNLVTGAFEGQLRDGNGNLIVNPGLWGLKFGNGGNGGAVNSLYFAAGGANEDVGVFGRIDVKSVPEPGAMIMLSLGGGVLCAFRLRRIGNKASISA